MHPRQVKSSGDLAGAVIVCHRRVAAERIEQLPLVAPRRHASGVVNHASPLTATDSCNKICH
jgi:hypothetical protein